MKVATAISLAGVAKGFSILHDRFVVDEIACACDAGASELLFVIFSAALLWIDLTVSQLYLSICIICIMQYGNVVCSLVVSRILYKTVFKISCSFFACDLYCNLRLMALPYPVLFVLDSGSPAQSGLSGDNWPLTSMANTCGKEANKTSWET